MRRVLTFKWWRKSRTARERADNVCFRVCVAAEHLRMHENMRLPSDVLRIVRQYASDKVPPTPTATIMKKVKITHAAESNHHGIYMPERLRVATEGPPVCYGTLFTIRVYFISDLLPSYWSDYANTQDNDEPRARKERRTFDE